MAGEPATWVADNLTTVMSAVTEERGARLSRISSDIVASALGLSERSGRTALTVLAEHHVVEPFGNRTNSGRPRRWWLAKELVDLVTNWSR